RAIPAPLIPPPMTRRSASKCSLTLLLPLEPGRGWPRTWVVHNFLGVNDQNHPFVVGEPGNIAFRSVSNIAFSNSPKLDTGRSIIVDDFDRATDFNEIVGIIELFNNTRDPGILPNVDRLGCGE